MILRLKTVRYDALEQEGFDREDIVGALVDVQIEIAKLPTHQAAVWDVFKGVGNLQDTESLQQWLYPQDRRDDFYESLRDFAKILKLALSNSKFQADTPESTKDRYRQDLKYFELRAMAKRWGSCTSSGKIFLNPLLVSAPKNCIDYVVIHELCHIHIHNHSPSFYRLLETILPDWKTRKDYLNQNVEFRS